jgi:hypothetical protein
MSDKPQIYNYNATTGKKTVRNLTDEEHAQYLENEANAPTIPTDPADA